MLPKTSSLLTKPGLSSRSAFHFLAHLRSIGDLRPWEKTPRIPRTPHALRQDIVRWAATTTEAADDFSRVYTRSPAHHRSFSSHSWDSHSSLNFRPTPAGFQPRRHPFSRLLEDLTSGYHSGKPDSGGDRAPVDHRIPSQWTHRKSGGSKLRKRAVYPLRPVASLKRNPVCTVHLRPPNDDAGGVPSSSSWGGDR